jgi:beta-lactam-binding protein with PASTA domain
MPTIMITNVTELQAMSSNLAGVYQLANAIDASATSGWNAGAGFVPIGTGTGALRFTGSLDGAGYAITGLVVNRAASDYQGLFGSTVGATISNIADVTGVVTGKDYVGGIIGRAYSSAISLCKCSATVSGASYAGCICGINSTSSSITGCYATGNVTLTVHYAGALVGANQSSATIIHCYSTGSASSASFAGGSVGWNSGATIIGCFATGAASTSTQYANSLVGFTTNVSVIQSSTGLTVPQAKDPRWYIAAAWDFTSTWVMPIAMPNIVGQTISAAQNLLSAQGCTLSITSSVYHATVPAGQIITQSIAAGGTAGFPQLQAFGMPASPKTGDVVAVTVSLGDQVEVQNTLGLTQAAATSLLTADSFTVTVNTATSETVAAGLVSAQSPAGGTLATYQSAVTITVSTGRANTEVPGVLGLSLLDATSAITAAGLVAANTTAYSNDFAAGLIISQSPAADTTVVIGSTVDIVTSLGVEQKTVPNVVGLTQAAAESAITGVSLVSSATTANSTTVAIGKVISQDPAAASTVDTGSTVDIVVSLGALVPDVVGDYYLCAKSLIESQSLVYASTMAYSATVPAGYIISQSPAAGASVAPGSTVTATISRGAQVGPLTYTLNTIKTVLSRSSAFRTWAGVATEALALNHIGILGMDSDYLPMAVISPGNWEREVVTLGGGSLTKPAVIIEFCKGVTRTDSDATVFATLIAAVDSIMLDIEAQGVWINLKWAPLNEDTPRRAGYAATNADWVGFSIVIEGDENEEI